jgi:hypothetical protein
VTPIEIAREHVIAAALSLAASRTYIDVSAPGPYDSAELEYRSDALDESLMRWNEATAESGHNNVHVIQFGEMGWIIQHPLAERANGLLFDCAYTWEGREIPERFGRFELLEGNVLGPEVG